MGLLLNRMNGCSVISLDDLSAKDTFPLEDVGGKLIILTHGNETASGGLGPGQLIANKLTNDSGVTEIIFLSCDAGKGDFLQAFSTALADAYIFLEDGVRGSKGSLYATFGEVEESSYCNLTVSDGVNCNKCNTEAKDALNTYKTDHHAHAEIIDDLLDFKGDSEKPADVIKWAKALANNEVAVRPWWNTSTAVYGSEIDNLSCTMPEVNAWTLIK
jgi:hypothetical protein